MCPCKLLMKLISLLIFSPPLYTLWPMILHNAFIFGFERWVNSLPWDAGAGIGWKSRIDQAPVPCLSQRTDCLLFSPVYPFPSASEIYIMWTFCEFFLYKILHKCIAYYSLIQYFRMIYSSINTSWSHGQQHCKCHLTLTNTIL